MKKFGWLLTIMLGVLCPHLHAAEYGALSERSAGRVLGVRMRDGYRFFVFVRPMPMDTWLCREYISGKEVEVYPKKLELMPFFDENDDFAIELLTTWHLLHPRMPEYARYAAFAQMIKLPRVSRTRHFIEMIRRQEKEIAELKKIISRRCRSPEQAVFPPEERILPVAAFPPPTVSARMTTSPNRQWFPPSSI